MIDDHLFIAIDLGAGSGRVFLVDLSTDGLRLEEIRRFTYPAAQVHRHMRWKFPDILAEIKAGLREAGTRGRELGRPIFSIGVDSWGVDYGLIDTSGEVIENPVCYRDNRTHGVMEEVFARIARKDIFDRTGIQFLSFNTLFQLFAHAKDRISERASRLLMIPDLVNFFLTGKAVTEYTNATTTQMVNAGTRTWDHEMIERLGLPSSMLCEPVAAGTDLGPLTGEMGSDLNLEAVRVIAPATHDTASAVAGTPLEDGWAYISSGTWSLVGVERSHPLINNEVERCNFTNEGGAFGTIRFLKNVMGLWILESCRREWNEIGLNVDYQSLLDELSSIEAGAVIFPDDPRFFNPPDMLAAIFEQLKEIGANDPGTWSRPAYLAKVILDSLALRYASVVRTIESLTGGKIKGVHIVGGGSRNEYLNKATASATGLQVKAGPVEATVIGNAVVQGISAGRFASLSEARLYIAAHTDVKTYEPSSSAAWEEATQRYLEIERRYLKE